MYGRLFQNGKLDKFRLGGNIMGEVDFTYELPESFNKRVVQFLQQFGNDKSVEAFQRCEYEYEDVGLAYYAGLKGDNWDKRTVDFTVEGYISIKICG